MPGMGGAQLLGREGELECLAGPAGEAAAGRGRLALIEGEPGIGKTWLLRAFFENAAGLFSCRVTGTAEEFDQRLPFATVDSCLKPLAAGDPRVADVLALIRGAGPEYPVIESVLALVEQWCAAGPVAVAVDDLHWADPASILLLHRLGRVAGQLPLLLVAVRRSGAGSPDCLGATSNTVTLTFVSPALPGQGASYTTGNITAAHAVVFGPIPNIWANSSGLVTVTITGVVTGMTFAAYLAPMTSGAKHNPFEMAGAGSADY